MSDNNSDLGAFLAGFVIGGLVGAATAIILAPQSGEETRSQLVNTSQSLATTGSERVAAMRDSATNYTQDYRDRAESLLDTTRNRLSDTGSMIQEQARIVLDNGTKTTDETSDAQPLESANGLHGDDEQTAES